MSANAIGWRRGRFTRTIFRYESEGSYATRARRVEPGGAAVIGFADIPDAVLGPLAGRPDADWHRAPPGKWTPAQIVQHLAIGIDGSGRTFESRRAKPSMRRRPRTAGQRLGCPPLVGPRWGIP